MSKHTPGPWKSERRNWKNEPSEHDIYITGDHFEEYPEDGGPDDGPTSCATAVAIVQGNATSHIVTEANANLIAAACEMLAACKALDEAQRFYGEHAEDPDGMPGNTFYSKLFMTVVRMAREAILKAEGAAQ